MKCRLQMRDVEVERDLRMLPLEAAAAMGHPICSELWSHRHSERLLLGAFLHLLQRLAKTLKCRNDGWKQHLPLWAEQHPSILPQEERHAKVRLQCPNLVAHRRLRDM